MTVALRNWRYGGARRYLLAAGNNDCTPLEAILNHYHKAYRDWLEAERIFKSLMLNKMKQESVLLLLEPNRAPAPTRLLLEPNRAPAPTRPSSRCSSVSSRASSGSSRLVARPYPILPAKVSGFAFTWKEKAEFRIRFKIQFTGKFTWRNMRGRIRLSRYTLPLK
jgi:hypothetical protein